MNLFTTQHHTGLNQPHHSVIADSVLQQAFAAATGNFRLFSALKSIHL